MQVAVFAANLLCYNRIVHIEAIAVGVGCTRAYRQIPERILILEAPGAQ